MLFLVLGDNPEEGKVATNISTKNAGPKTDDTKAVKEESLETKVQEDVTGDVKTGRLKMDQVAKMKSKIPIKI